MILPGLYPVVGSTEAEAWARKKNEMDALLDLDEERDKLAVRLQYRSEATSSRSTLSADILDTVSALEYE